MRISASKVEHLKTFEAGNSGEKLDEFVMNKSEEILQNKPIVAICVERNKLTDSNYKFL